MTDALITNLASLPALRVISRQSVMRYKGSTKPLPEIARELGVEGVVEGSVVRSGGRVRITAQLVHAPTDRHLWARSYERRMEDVLALQGELSRAIAEEVRLTVGTKESQRLTPERTVKPEAYDAYLLGRHHWNLRTAQSLDKALSYFQAAIAADPDFALAHAGLALAYGPRLVYGYVPPGHGLAEQKTAALRALELDPGLGEARAALGSVRTQEWDWQGAETEFRNAIEARAPTTLWYGWYLYAVGRADEALVQERRAMELDPLNIMGNRALAQFLGATGQDEAALAQWNRALELEPDHAQSELQLALFHFEHGRIEEGSMYLDRARSHAGDDPLTVAQLAVACAVSGNADEARHLLGRLKTQSASRYVSKVLPAYVHLALDERDRAFALLEEAYRARDPLLISIQMGTVGPFLYVTKERAAALHSDPRFGDLLRRMGLVSRAPASHPMNAAGHLHCQRQVSDGHGFSLYSSPNGPAPARYLRARTSSGAERSVGETRAIGQSSRVFAGGQPLPMASVVVPRHVRSSRPGGARSRQPRAARTLHRTVVHPRSRPRGYATSSPAPWPRPPPSSSSPRTLRRSTRLFQYGDRDRATAAAPRPPRPPWRGNGRCSRDL